MKLQCLLLLVTFEAQAKNVQVEGEITFRLNAPFSSEQYRKPKNTDMVEEEKEQAGDESRVVRGHESGMTVAPVVECMYQIPEETQVLALLSNMMNELTKMFVRAHEMMNTDNRRKGETRFKVVSKKQTDFFEDIYSTMTKQYLTFYNSTTVRVDRSGRKKDPCANQEEMKMLWKDLLENSLTIFRQAAFKCIDEHLKAKGQSKDSKDRERMGKYLLRELSKIKMSQLALLCDKFQLCYDELIRRNDKV